MNLPEGWLTATEADELRLLAAGQTVLELGAWKGRSTVVMAEVARVVVSVDKHQGIEGHGLSLHEYLANVEHLSNVVPVIGDWTACRGMFAPDFFTLVYVDGMHDADSVERDFILACNLTAGTVCGHDYDFESVREGTKRVFGDRAPDRVVGSIASWEL